MYQVWEGDLFLFYCESDEVDLYVEQGFSIVSEAK